MDHELLEMLREYLVLHRMNAEGRPVIEAAVRARALQELSGLTTADLTRLAHERAGEQCAENANCSDLCTFPGHA